MSGPRAATAAFVLAITLSAGLLFMVEPMITKMLLPRFGGSAAVWSVAIVFFQASLLLGYLYAHALTRLVTPSTAAVIHASVLVAGLFTLPFTMPQEAASTHPSLGVLLALAAAIGLPFTALAANAPLLQAWYARSAPPGTAARDPYPLYAASNAGSLVALLAYPLLIEPAATLRNQSLAWSWGYAALIAAIGLAVALGRPSGGRGGTAAATVDRRWLMWVGLALVPSAGLVAVTAHISSDVAAAPFLWVAPLALYLLSFVLAFGSRTAQWLGGARAVLPLLLAGVTAALGFNLRLGLVPDVILHLVTFTAIALVFHGLLAARRPAAEALTGYYLALSVGGLLGGIAAALVAPNVFSFVAEYPLVLIIAALGAMLPLVATPVVLALLVIPPLLWPSAQESVTRRSFYGVHRMEVTPDGQFRVLRHGQEIHGAVRLRNADGSPAAKPPKAMTYYHEDGPIAWAVEAARNAKAAPIRIGVVGLGTGSMACMTEPGDTLHFYEIDPEIIRIARDPALFGFIAGCAPGVRIVEGDARLMLAREQAAYDVLVIDAFSSDAIPAHLITREALRTYMQRLAPGGMLVVHISNDHLRLNEIVDATARAEGLKIRIYDEYADDAAPTLIYQPTVAIIAREEAHFGELAQNDEWPVPETDGTAAAWTDDFSNLLSAIIAKARED